MADSSSIISAAANAERWALGKKFRNAARLASVTPLRPDARMVKPSGKGAGARTPKGPKPDLRKKKRPKKKEDDASAAPKESAEVRPRIPR